MVDVPDTEGLDRYSDDIRDLDIVAYIDDEDVFSHTYEEREKKMRVSFMPQDAVFGFRFINSKDDSLAGKPLTAGAVQIPMAKLRQVDQNEAIFWLNLRPTDENVFNGKLGTDDDHTGEAWMLLKMAILEETVQEGPPVSPDRDLNEDFEQMKHDLGNKMQQELSASPVKPKKEVRKPEQKHMHKTLEEL